MRRMMSQVALAAALLLLPATARAQQLVYFGTFANTPDAGVVAARFDPRTGALAKIGTVATLAGATWLLAAPHQPLLYSVAGSTIVSFRVDRGSGALTEQSRATSGGADATYLALTSPPATLLVANYGSGTIAALPVAADGALAPPVSIQSDTGTGPSPRQRGPHAHGIAVAPGGRWIVATDLGADRLFVYALDPAARALAPAATPFAQAPAGTGPRHGVFSRDGRFFWANSELSAEITAFLWDAATGRLTSLKTISTLPAASTATKNAGEILLAPDGRYLYATNRGEDTIVVYRIDPASGGLSETQRIVTGGKRPWALAFDATGRWLLVANQSSDQVAVMAVDPRSGKLAPTSQAITLAQPTSIAFIAP